MREIIITKKNKDFQLQARVTSETYKKVIKLAEKNELTVSAMLGKIIDTIIDDVKIIKPKD